jgi:hypothetical protein
VAALLQVYKPFKEVDGPDRHWPDVVKSGLYIGNNYVIQVGTIFAINIIKEQLGMSSPTSRAIMTGAVVGGVLSELTDQHEDGQQASLIQSTLLGVEHGMALLAFILMAIMVFGLILDLVVGLPLILYARSTFQTVIYDDEANRKKMTGVEYEKFAQERWMNTSYEELKRATMRVKEFNSQ